MNTVTVALAGVLSLGAVAAAQTIVSDTPISDVIATGISTPLDLSSRSIGATGPNFNRFESTFADSSGFTVTGTIVAEVFANANTLGPGLTDVIIKYTFTNTGIDVIDTISLGTDGGASLDAGDLLGSTQGTVTDSTSAGQLTPKVLIDAPGSNTVLKFDFNDILGPADQLAPTESFSWYIQSSGDIALAPIQVNITNLVPADGFTIGIVDANAGQPDLNVPAPGAFALAGIGFAFASRRRRA